MSIDNLFDAYAAERGIRRRAEVVPDHPCQVFTDFSPDSQPDAPADHEAAEQLERTRELVAELLGDGAPAGRARR